MSIRAFVCQRIHGSTPTLESELRSPRTQASREEEEAAEPGLPTPPCRSSSPPRSAARSPPRRILKIPARPDRRPGCRRSRRSSTTSGAFTACAIASRSRVMIGAGSALWREQPGPDVELDVLVAEFLEGRQIGKTRDPLRAPVRQYAHLAVIDLLLQRARRRGHRLHRAARAAPSAPARRRGTAHATA